MVKFEEGKGERYLILIERANFTLGVPVFFYTRLHRLSGGKANERTGFIKSVGGRFEVGFYWWKGID